MINFNYQMFLDFLNVQFWGNSGQDYLNVFLLFVALIIVFKLFQVLILSRLNRLADRTETDIDNLAIKIVKDIKPPFYFVVASYISLRFLVLNGFFEKLVDITFIIVVTYQVIAVMNRVIEFITRKIVSREANNAEKDVAAINMISKVIRAGVWVIGILVVLSSMGINVTSVIAGLGIGGIAVALAVQSILSDVFSSISIFVDKPFKVGDFIVIGGKDSGTVKHIGINTTRIKTLQGEELVVSNKDLTTERVQNFQRMERRRVLFSLGVTYGTKSEQLKKIPSLVKEAVESVDKATFDRAHFKDYGDFSLNFEIVYYVENSSYDKYMDVNQEINLKIFDAFAKEKIEFAYPTQTVFVNK